jgi:prolyl-tRNA synthetase
MARTSVLTPQAEDFPRWYQDVVAKAELADNGPVRGTMVILPYGYALWERMQAEVDARIKAAGAKNCYFPLFIPENYLHREAEHVEGFSPELAVVTHGGGKELEEPVVVRPTSETVIGATYDDAAAYAQRILHEVYSDFMVNVLAIPIVKGRKTTRERFPGAINTMTCEAMMRDGKALQMGTSHELGQNFARAFEIQHLDAAGQQQLCWTTSWGASTRMVGGLIMCHGDDAGLRVPPRLAPTQVVVVLVKDDGGAGAAAEALVKGLDAAGVRVELDARVDVSFGRRSVDWELKGVPVRLEVGPRDVAEGVVTVVRRDLGTKESVPLATVAVDMPELLECIQTDMLATATAARDARTHEATNVEQAIEASAEGWATMDWDALRASDGESRLREQGVTVRCLVAADGSLPEAEDSPGNIAYVGRAY